MSARKPRLKIPEGHSAVLLAFAALGLFLLLLAGIIPTQGRCLSDECVYIADGIRYLRQGLLFSGLHVDNDIVKSGLSHIGSHVSGFPFVLGWVFHLLAPTVSSVFFWNALVYAAALFAYGWSVRRSAGLTAGAFLVALGILHPSVWSWVRWITPDLTLFGLTVVSVLFFEKAMTSAKPWALLPFALVCAAKVGIKESEMIPFLVGAGVWTFWRPKLIKDLPRVSATLVGSLVLVLLSFRYFAANRAAVTPLDAGALAVLKAVFVTKQYDLFEGISRIVSHAVEQTSIYFSFNGVDADYAPIRYWYVLLIVWSGIRLRTVPLKGNPTLVFGWLSTTLTFIACMILFLSADARAIRVMHTGSVILLLGLARSYLPLLKQKKFFSTQPALWVFCAICLILSAREFKLWSSFRRVDDETARPIAALVSHGAANHKGDQVLYYDFSNKFSFGFDAALYLHLALNQKMAEVSGPYYHLVYFGFYNKLEQRQEVLEKFRATGLCPVFAVVHEESGGGVDELRKYCGTYERIDMIAGKHHSGWTERDWIATWTAPLYVKRQ